MADAVSFEGLEDVWHPDGEPLFINKPPEWVSTYLVRYCELAAIRTAGDCKGFALTVRELQRDGFWERLFPDWETCCRSLFKRPAVWVENIVEGVRILHGKGHQGAIPRDQALAAAAAQAEPLAQHGTNQHSGTNEGPDNINSSKGGTSQAYLLRRLARDAPEILERVKTGEIKSARAAAIEAGIIKSIPTVQLVDDMAKVAAKLRQHLSPEQRLTLIDLIAPDL
jgi:hypothetical protein